MATEGWTDFSGIRRFALYAPREQRSNGPWRRFCFHCRKLTQFFRTNDGEVNGLPECVDCVRRIYGTTLCAEPEQERKPKPKPPAQPRPEPKARPPLVSLMPMILSGVAMPALHKQTGE